MALHLTWGEYLAVAGIIVIGAFCQGTIGFGMNLLAAPVVGLVAPQLLPATMVVVGVPMSVAMAVREHHHIDWRSVGWISVGRLPGVALGAWLVAIMSVRALGGVVGAIVVVAVSVSIWSQRHDLSPRAALGAGTASGFMDTVAATGGPPVALLFQHRPAQEVRSSLAVVFLVGTALSLGGLALAGKVAGWQLLAAVALAPALGVGLLASHRLAAATAGRPLRPWVLGTAGAAGVAALARALVG